MTKFKFFFIILLFLFTCTFSVSAEEIRYNYLRLRYEVGKTNDGRGYNATSNLYENYKLKYAVLGFRVITKQKGYNIIVPHAYYKINKKFMLGGMYMFDSEDNEWMGPSIRLCGTYKRAKCFLLYTYYFDLHENKNFHDAWVGVSNAVKQGWIYGSEIYYYSFKNGIENLKLRPLKIEYKFKNGIQPFIMFQRHFKDNGYRADALQIGLRLRY